MIDHIKLFQTERVWAQIKDKVFDQVNQFHGYGVAQNGLPTEQLETSLSELFAMKHAVTTANCTDALTLALKALKLPKNAPVAVSNYTFTASAHAICRAGYQVVPVDVREDYTIDVDKIPDDVEAVVVVDIFGNMSDWQSLNRLDIPLINDAAQSFESFDGLAMSPQYGTLSCVSFSPSKTVSSWGSGGAVLTNDAILAERIRLMRLHGKEKNYVTAIDSGLNSMMSTMECVCVANGLDLMDEWRARRENIAEYIISNSRFETAIDYLPRHTLHKLVFQAEDRTAVSDMLNSKKIDCAYHYSLLINDEPIYHRKGEFPVSDRLKKISFTVPNQHTLTDDEVERIARALR